MDWGARHGGIDELVALFSQVQPARGDVCIGLGARPDRFHAAQQNIADDPRGQAGKRRHHGDTRPVGGTHGVVRLGLRQEFLAAAQIVGDAAVPVVVPEVSEEPLFQHLLPEFEVSEEPLFQHLLPEFIEGIFAILAVDEHGVVPLFHAEQDDYPVPPEPVAKPAVVIELVGGLVYAAVAIVGIVVYDGEIDPAVMALGNSLRAVLQLLPLLVCEQAADIIHILHTAAALPGSFGHFRCGAVWRAVG